MKGTKTVSSFCRTTNGHSDFVFQTDASPRSTIPDHLILHRAHLPLCQLRYEVLRDGPTEAIIDAFDQDLRPARIHFENDSASRLKVVGDEHESALLGSLDLRGDVL